MDRFVCAVLDRSLGDQRVRRLEEQRPAGGEENRGSRMTTHVTNPGRRARVGRPIPQRKGLDDDGG